uniref:Reverse transcriptase domain-containing protein n=1 Tax=Tanacetum cinerariifolium TaxID=118510 RepID=A0A6L2NCB5_TANCI|nr:reverse transcriptase domain-containing protein [Tanacetum cinerariifolium]
MTPEFVQAMIDQALLRNSTNGDGSHCSHEDNQRNVKTARPCFYADFMKCQPLNFKGTEGVVGLTRWIEKMESFFQISGCAIENQVKFATCTLLDVALTWWNSQIRSLGPDAYSMTWEVLKKKMTDKYCPQGEIKKLEIKLWNLKFVANETEKIDKYVNRLPDNIYRSVKASKPKTLDETIELANDLMDQKLRTYAERQTNNKRKTSDSFRNNHGHQKQPLKRFICQSLQFCWSQTSHTKSSDEILKPVFWQGFSKQGAAQIWLEKEPPRSITTWEDLVSKFINQFFPPSNTTNLRNKITNFQQRFDESFCEAWEHFKDLLHACPHHGFTKLHQIDTFYNSLTSTDQDSLNAAADGNLLTKTPKDALTLIENKSKVRTSRNRPVVAKNTTPPPASVKAVEESRVTCGGPHPYYQCLATDGNAFPGYHDNIQAYVSAAAVNYNQGNAGHRPSSVAHQVRPPDFLPATMLQQNNKLENMLSNYFQTNKPSGSGVIPSNTVTNPKGDLKAITTRSGVSYDGPLIPPPFFPTPKVVERGPEVTKDLVHPSTEKVQPSDVQTQAPTFELVNAPNFSDALLYMPKFASTFKNLLNNKEKLFEVTNTPVNENCSAVILNKLPEKLGDPELTLRVGDEAITFQVGNTLKFSYNYAESINRIDAIDVALEEYSQEVLGFSGNFESGNPTSAAEPIIARSSPSLTPFKGGDFILEEIESHDSVLREINSEDISEFFSTFPIPLENCDFFFKKIKRFTSVPEFETFIFDLEEKNADVSLPKYECFYSKGDIRLLEKLLNEDPSSSLPPKEIKTEELKSVKSSRD